MARKLKSDKVLFLATILLVALSVVMVYSASAVQADKMGQFLEGGSKLTPPRKK